MTTQSLQFSDFTPHLSSTFSLYYDEATDPMVVELIEANELKHKRPRDLGKAFSLVFRGQLDVVLPQKIYQF